MVLKIAEYQVQNIVASASLGAELDLDTLSINLNGAEYEPHAFPGLVFRLKDPKTATLLFRSGKLVCTGAKNLEDLDKAIRKVANEVRQAGAKIAEGVPRYEVQNIVASADLGQPVDLTAAVISLGLENVEYEPEVFPGMVYRLSEPKVVILLFGSGRCVCTGAHKAEDVEAAMAKIRKDLVEAGLLV
jgi:transcription initiation factor TFIID TATA-box-binding protein